MVYKHQPPRVLIVEDEIDFGLLLERFLRDKFKAESVVAKDCAEARSAFYDSPFNLITLDNKLPDGTGLELLEEIIQVEKHPPIIMVTGEGDETTASLAIGLGAAGYVVKDNRLTVLLTRTIEVALDKERYRMALLESERQYRELVELANSIILKMDKEGNLLFINRYGADFFGYKESEIIGRNVVGTIVPEVESTGRGLSSVIRDIVHDPDAHRSNFNENVLHNGKRVWILWGNRSIRDKEGNISGTLSVGNDVTELVNTTARLERLKRLYVLVISIIQDLPDATDPRELYIQVCRSAVESGLFKMAWIGILNDDTGDITPVAADGDCEKYLNLVKFNLGAFESQEQGPVEIAVRDCRRSICNDILQYKGKEEWREQAIRCGYGSLAAYPLVSDGRAIGVISLYADTPGLFGEEILQVIEMLASNISYAVQSHELRVGKNTG